MKAERTSCRETAGGIDSEELRLWVEDCLGERADTFVRHSLPGSSSFTCELLKVRRDGRTQEFLFKDFGRCRLPRDDRSGARREIEVYRSVLDHERLGTPRHFGSLRAPEDGHSWLLLEHVRGSRLAERSFGHWLAAAAWLGRLQGLAAARALAVRPPAELVLHDREELRATTEAALRAVASVDVLLERGLWEALDGHEYILEELCELPRTLVNGAFRPLNVLVDPYVSPERVAPVDWEHAALGCGFYDVASLSAGLERHKVELLIEAQRASAAEHGLLLPEGEEAWELVTILRLHQLLRSLGHAQSASHAREAVEHMIALAGRLRLELRAARQARARARVSIDADSPELVDPHPARNAWKSLGREGTAANVDLICGSIFAHKGRALYRLEIVGAPCSSVVAKHSRRASLALERQFYAELLPSLGVPSAQYLGWVADGAANWLFLEDVGMTRIDPDDAAQRACALRWLARLHAASARLAPEARPPDLGPPRVHALLREAQRSILAAMENPMLRPRDEQALRNVAAACARVEAGWDLIEAACKAMPATLAQGDFRPKNLLMRRNENGLEILPIDWEYAGWGVPAIDLGSILRGPISRTDLELYRDALPDSGAGVTRHMSLETLTVWVLAGRILRASISIQWESIGLEKLTCLDSPIHNLGSYTRALSAAFEELARQ